MISKLKLIVASAALFGLTTSALAKGDHQMSPRKAAMLAKFDANTDGTLDAAEKAKLIEARTAMHDLRVEKRFAKLDANKDGVITLAEMKAGKHGGKGKGFRHHRKMNK